MFKVTGYLECKLEYMNMILKKILYTVQEFHIMVKGRIICVCVCVCVFVCVFMILFTLFNDFDKLWCECFVIVGNHNPVPCKFRTGTNNCMEDVGPC